MPRSKYAKCIKTTSLMAEIPYYTGKSMVAHRGELDADCSLGYHHISKAMSFDEPHSHDFAEMLCFIGSNPQDIADLGAEIEFTLGGEKHQISTAAVVSIPPNVTHCPIVIKNVQRPLVFMEISLTRKWKPARSRRKPASQSGADSQEQP